MVMFQVVRKDYNSLESDILDNIESVYDVKRDFESNEIMFLFYDTKKGWIYRPAEDFVPVR